MPRFTRRQTRPGGARRSRARDLAADDTGGTVRGPVTDDNGAVAIPGRHRAEAAVAGMAVAADGRHERAAADEDDEWAGCARQRWAGQNGAGAGPGKRSA